MHPPRVAPSITCSVLHQQCAKGLNTVGKLDWHSSCSEDKELDNKDSQVGGCREGSKKGRWVGGKKKIGRRDKAKLFKKKKNKSKAP